MGTVPMKQHIIDLYDNIGYKQEILEFYSQSDFLNFGYWDHHTANQKQACENLMERLLAYISEKRGTILDVACGKGATTAYLLKYYPPENIIGINISEKQLETARANAPGCTFLTMNATDLKFEDEYFDNIICVEAAFHFNTRKKFLEEALRVLKPGGSLVLSDVLMTLGGEKIRKGGTTENYVRDLEEYKTIFSQVGFGQVEIVDATKPCWEMHFWQVVRAAHRKFLAKQINQTQLQDLLANTYHRVPFITYYLLAAAKKS
jgi:MPBQ/MSBQ methyltransferase